MLRFAQSPQRDMHIDDMRNALFAYIISKQLNEQLLIRIDDNEKEKNIEGKEKEILELLELFSIDYSTTIYQSENLKYHQKLAMQLMSQKKAFACFCGEDKLKELEKYDGFCSSLSDETVLNCNSPFTVRINKSQKDIQFTDLLSGSFSYKADDIDMFNILNHDKTPTNDFASALNDMFYDISFVVSHSDSNINTASQINIRTQLNYDKEIKYLHTPKLTNGEEITIKSLIKKGYLPGAIANYLVVLGNATPKDIFSIEEAIEWFDIKKLSKSSIKFNIDELKAMNKKYINNLDDMRLSKIIGYADKDIGKLAKLYLNESNTINDIKDKINTIFSIKSRLKGYENEYTKVVTELKSAPYFENLNDLINYLEKNCNLKDDSLLKPLSYLLCGSINGANLKDVYPLIKNYIGEIAK